MIKTPIDLETFVIAKGSHISFEKGACAMELVAYMAGEPWSDHPKCASPVISAFVRSWNDAMNDVDRQMLKPYIARLIGSAAPKEIETRRAYLAADWYTRVAVPRVFRQAGWIEEADRLEQLREVVNKETSAAASTELRTARDFAYAKRAEQRAALSVKIKEQIGDAGAAGAAGDAGDAWDAWDAGDEGAAGDAWDAWDAGDAGAAWAAWAAGAAWAAWDAWAAGEFGALPKKIAEAIKNKKPSQSVYDVTYNVVYTEMRPRYEEALRPLTVELQASALQLLDRMIACGTEVPA